MIVRPFNDADLTQAGEIALHLWGDDIPHAETETKYLIYQYLVRYYYYPNSEYCFGVFEDEILQGMLLAYPHGSPANNANEWLRPHITMKNRSILENYCAYLDGNRHKEHAAANENEMILALFASRRKGCGKLLMQAFEEKCKNNGIRSMLLWTDDTCDFSYYHYNRFIEVAKMPTEPSIDNLKLTTYLFRKHFAVC